MTVDRLRNRFRRKMAAVADLFSRVLASTHPATKSRSLQRMCPFCGLITPRVGRNCLECGKPLMDG
jgi:hypothetical protein